MTQDIIVVSVGVAVRLPLFPVANKASCRGDAGCDRQGRMQQAKMRRTAGAR